MLKIVTEKPGKVEEYGKQIDRHPGLTPSHEGFPVRYFDKLFRQRLTITVHMLYIRHKTNYTRLRQNFILSRHETLYSMGYALQGSVAHMDLTMHTGNVQFEWVTTAYTLHRIQ